MLEIEDAMVKVTMGPEKKSRVISDKEKRLVAFHEAGHAVASRFLETQDDVHQISIIPRGMAGGYTMYRPSEDRSFMSKSEMEEQIISLLGGRVAEALVLGDISTGASNDIERASKIARAMVTKYGMSEKLGSIMFGSGQEEVFLGRDYMTDKNFSDQVALEIDKEVRHIIEECYEKAKQVINDVIASTDNILMDPQPFVRVVSHGESTINIVTRLWVKSEHYWGVYFDMMESIKKSFDSANIEIPYKQLDVHIKQN